MAPSPSRPEPGFPRLYAILDVAFAESHGLRPLDVLEEWLGAGVRLVQLRAKSMTFGPMLDLAERCTTLSKEADARLIVNDRADVARLALAFGLHLGQQDLPIASARAILASGQIIGLSTHYASQTAAGLGDADYVAIGPVFETMTKDRTEKTVGLDGVASAAALARTAGKPLVAIGGISLASAPAVIESGADAVAVISDLLAGDWRQQVRKYLHVLQ